MNTNIKKYFSLALQIIIAAIYVQTLYYKFTAHPDSVYIFSKLGLEPYGRIVIGILELITAILILMPKTKIMGALLSLGIICGAIYSHIGPLGIEVQGDGGKVFYLALIILVATMVFLVLNFKEMMALSRKIFNESIDKNRLK